MNEKTSITGKYAVLALLMNERTRRVWAAKEAEAIGWGGVSLVSEATGLSRTTITQAMKELRRPRLTAKRLGERVRARGAGRKMLSEMDAELIKELEKLVEWSTRGDPESPLRWTLKSTRNLSDELKRLGHPASAMTISRLLDERGYSLQSNRKKLEGKSAPDRDAQFQFIASKVKEFHSLRMPVISVDAKKKESVGNFKNVGQEWRRKGKPDETNTDSFVDKKKGDGIGIPYGVYDIFENKGWVSVGIDHNTAEFAVATIKQWWNEMGKLSYPQAQNLLITADGGGSNASRSHLWKKHLQTLADDLQLELSVCHFPPGTSKWNKIEHQMFSHITRNWRGKPLRSHEIMVNLIANTKTRKGLKINSGIDRGAYEIGTKVSKNELKSLNIIRDSFHGEWNYTIAPRKLR
jgi:hypothetical protein